MVEIAIKKCFVGEQWNGMEWMRFVKQEVKWWGNKVVLPLKKRRLHKRWWNPLTERLLPDYNLFLKGCILTLVTFAKDLIDAIFGPGLSHLRSSHKCATEARKEGGTGSPHLQFWILYFHPVFRAEIFSCFFFKRYRVSTPALLNSKSCFFGQKYFLVFFYKVRGHHT